MNQEKHLLEEVDFMVNQEPRCPVVLLLDTSSSMGGSPINELNQGIKTFKQAVQKDAKASLRVELAVITFNNSVNIIQEFVSVDNFSPPELVASGSTSMGTGIVNALDMAEKRKEFLKNKGNAYYKPWIFMITDGAPSDEWKNAAYRVHDAVENRKLSFFAVGVSGADIEILKQITHPRTPPVMLKGLNFNEMFVWLSRSMVRVSTSQVGEQVELPQLTWTIEA